MTAGKHDIVVEQGTTFNKLIFMNSGSGDPIDITGWTFRGQIRPTYSDPTIVAVFTGSIVSALEGQAKVSLTAADTSAIPVNEASDYKKQFTKCVYDVEAVKADGTVIRVLEGTAFISPEVTR